MLHTGDYADAVSRVQSGADDVSVAAGPDLLPKALRYQTLQLSPLRFVAPAFSCTVADQVSAQAGRDGSVEDWADIPFIVTERGLSRERLDTWFRGRPGKPRIYAQVAGHEAIAAMVGLGLGVGVVPDLVLDNSTYRDKLQIVPVDAALGTFPVGLCALAQRLENPLVQAFWQTAARAYAGTQITG